MGLSRLHLVLEDAHAVHAFWRLRRDGLLILGCFWRESSVLGVVS